MRGRCCNLADSFRCTFGGARVLPLRISCSGAGVPFSASRFAAAVPVASQPLAADRALLQLCPLYLPVPSELPQHLPRYLQVRTRPPSVFIVLVHTPPVRLERLRRLDLSAFSPLVVRSDADGSWHGIQRGAKHRSVVATAVARPGMGCGGGGVVQVVVVMQLVGMAVLKCARHLHLRSTVECLRLRTPARQTARSSARGLTPGCTCAASSAVWSPTRTPWMPASVR